MSKFEVTNWYLKSKTLTILTSENVKFVVNEADKIKNESLIPTERIEKRIYVIRGEKVMLDKDLSELYEVDTKTLNRAVQRNVERFPEDFMFQLTNEEAEFLRYQFGTSKTEGRGGRRYLPYVFTEQGVASQCSPACCARHALFESISKLCGRLSN